MATTSGAPTRDRPIDDQNRPSTSPHRSDIRDDEATPDPVVPAFPPHRDEDLLSHLTLQNAGQQQSIAEPQGGGDHGILHVGVGRDGAELENNIVSMESPAAGAAAGASDADYDSIYYYDEVRQRKMQQPPPTWNQQPQMPLTHPQQHPQPQPAMQPQPQQPRYTSAAPLAAPQAQPASADEVRTLDWRLAVMDGGKLYLQPVCSFRRGCFHQSHSKQAK
ncbi:hypothetical protein ACLOJK_026660 [Asimina triloba]